MNDAPHPALLPAGLYDLLPPDAEIEAEVTGRLMGILASHGYQQVKPPLVEFEETLLSGAGTATASDTFRLMDPISHRMVGVRADMTPQVARIATTRMSHMPRPLRLSYAGQVLRVKGSEMRPERQIGQAGAELIGAEGPAADVESIAVAGEALQAVGVPHLSVDLTLPTLVPAIVEAYGLGGEREAALRAALDHKDATAVAALAGKAGRLLAELIAAAGIATATRAALDRLDLPPRARQERDRLGAVLDGLARTDPEHGPLGELGRGGRYQAGDPAMPEPATGFTLYTNTILRTLPQVPRRRRVLVPLGADRDHARALREAGWVTVAALSPSADGHAEAHRLGCDYVIEDREPRPLAPSSKR